MLSVITRAIEDEEHRQGIQAQEKTPGVFEIFLTEDALDRADRASRIVQAPSLAAFCRDVIADAADRILAEEAASTDLTGSGDIPNPIESLPTDAGTASAGSSSPGSSKSDVA